MDRICTQCGKGFFNTVHNRKFCSLGCRGKYYYEQYSILKGRIKLGKVSRKCATCNKYFNIRAANQVYCSKECVTPKISLCVVCCLEKEMYTIGKCRSCWKKGYLLQKNPPKKKECLYCHYSFETRKPEKIFCSDKCKVIYHSSTNKKKEYDGIYRKSGKMEQNYKRWLERNPGRRKEILRKYDKTPKGIISRLKRDHRRKELLEKDIFRLTQDKVQKIIERDKICVYCGNLDKLTWDHIVPVSKGGTWEFNNIVRSCMKCQISKGAKDVVKWCEQKGITVPKVVCKLLQDQKRQKKITS